MRVCCRYCHAEYETPVTQTALGFVDRCDRCGRAGLQEVADDGPVAAARPADEATAASPGLSGERPDRARS
jgi:hypothetical protein